MVKIMAIGYLFTAASNSPDFVKVADIVKKRKPKAMLASCGLMGLKDRWAYVKTGLEMVYKGLNPFNKTGVIGFESYEKEDVS